MKTTTAVPADFPRRVLAAVPGIQPKLCVRLVGDKYVSGWTDEELQCRHDNCQDLVCQLVAYAIRKATENPDWTLEFNLDRIEKALANKGRSGEWDVTTDEQAWIMVQIRATLGREKG